MKFYITRWVPSYTSVAVILLRPEEKEVGNVGVYEGKGMRDECFGTRNSTNARSTCNSEEKKTTQR